VKEASSTVVRGKEGIRPWLERGLGKKGGETRDQTSRQKEQQTGYQISQKSAEKRG